MNEPSYDRRYFDQLYRVEDRHFWFQTRNAIISKLVRQVTNSWQPGYRVLEVGCGTGNVLRYLQAACRGGTVVGMDLFRLGLQRARRRTSCLLVEGDTSQPAGPAV